MPVDPEVTMTAQEIVARYYDAAELRAAMAQAG
jgi:hypothetical protein